MAFTGLRCGNCGAPSAIETSDRRVFFTSKGFVDTQELTEQIYLGFANEDAHLMASVGFV
jgi:hypothetical protein